jgi:phage-related protein (TIGR01555 family)
VTNSLTELAGQLAFINGVTGGSTLSSYGTAAYSNNYALLTLNRIILTYMYTGNGLFQTAIQQPILDAIGKGIEIDCPEISSADVDDVLEKWEDFDLWTTILDAWTWVRLFGGGAVLINSNQDPEQPIDFDEFHRQPLEFYDLDRWQLDVNLSYINDNDAFQKNPDPDTLFYIYGTPVHNSRFLMGRGKRAPHYVRQQLRGWGMSEGERMIRDLNLYLKTQDVTYELLDEAKVDIYKINGLAQKMMTTGGTTAITTRIQTANQIKNYINALVLDAQEEYESKSMTFSGLAEVMQENRIGIAAALRIPENKLFGQSATGFASGQDTLEVYNAMVEAEVRKPLNPIVRNLLKVMFSYALGYVPSFSFSWPSLRELTPEVEQQVKDAEANRLFNFYDRGLIDSAEIMQQSEKSALIEIETKAGKGLLPPQPEAPEKPDDMGFGLMSNKSEFDESKHPRDEDGKFGTGGGGSSKTEKTEKDKGAGEVDQKYKDFKDKKLIGGRKLHQLGSERFTDDTDYLIYDSDNPELFIKKDGVDYVNAAAHPFYKEIWQMDKKNKDASLEALFEMAVFTFVQHAENGQWDKADTKEYDIKFLARKMGGNVNFDITRKYISIGATGEVEKILADIRGIKQKKNSLFNFKVFRKRKNSFDPDGFHVDVEKETKKNKNYRKVIYTGPHAQLVLVSLKPGEEIGMETHLNLDQFIRFEGGTGIAIISGKKYSVKDGDAIVIPAGSEHNIIAKTELKLYAVYTEKEHPDKLIEKEKNDNPA